MKTCTYECIIMYVSMYHHVCWVEFTKLVNGFLYMTLYLVDFYILPTYLFWGNTAILKCNLFNYEY